MSKWVAYVGCFTKAGCADPFESMGGVPHNRSQVGDGVRMLAVERDGTLKVEDTLLQVVNPSFLFLYPPQRPHTLYVVSETEVGKLHSFAIPQQPGEAHRSLGEQPTDGGDPCHLETAGVNSSLLMVANYSGGSMAVFGTSQPEAAKPLEPMLQMIEHKGSSVHAARQTAAHAHSSVSRGDFVFVADLGMDVVFTYALDGASANPLRELHRFAAPPGSGPRSLAIHPTLDFLAVSCELSGKAVVLRILPAGALEFVAEADAYPQDWPGEGSESRAKFNGGLWVSDLCWSPGGKFVYVAARLHNSISVLAFDAAAGTVIVVQRLASGGETPRCLCMAPDGSLLIVAHHHGHSVCSFAVDATSGHLTAAHSLQLPQASCVKMCSRS